MGLFEGSEGKFAEAIARLTHQNPFLPQRIELEREALGSAFSGTAGVWSVDADLNGLNPNLGEIDERVGELLPALRDRLAKGASAGDAELRIYEDLVLYSLYSRYGQEWFTLMLGEPGGGRRAATCYERFGQDARELLAIPGVALPHGIDEAFLFAWGFQTRRAFHHTFRQLHGASLPAAGLRAAVWESVFTHDRRRFRRGLHERMRDLATLIVGPSGTGKELVARAIALSRFVPFDAQTGRFVEDYRDHFSALNLSALSPMLVESELFGHARGAFTGALDDHTGWLESCSSLGTVFLDEIGELDPGLQVKLLRVLQSRTFQRLGETAERRFEGKIVAATNRDLAAGIREGHFREDLYYRLCSDVIRTPSLREQLDDAPEDVANLVLVIARRDFGPEIGDELAEEVLAWIRDELGADYPWPGNVRELEQCVRNILVRRSYRPESPVAPEPARGPATALADAVARGSLDTEELLRRYTTWVYHRAGSYEEAARRLGVDRRTVKARVDEGLLRQLREA